MKPIVVFKTLFFSFADLLVDEATASSLRENKASFRSSTKSFKSFIPAHSLSIVIIYVAKNS